MTYTTAIPTSYSFYYTKTTVLATVWTWSSTLHESVPTVESTVETVVYVPTQWTIITVPSVTTVWDSSIDTVVTETITVQISVPTSAKLEYSTVTVYYVATVWSSTHSTFVETVVSYHTVVVTGAYYNGVDVVSYPSSVEVSHPSCHDNFLGM